MAESYYSQSPYHFSGNNPIRFIDDNGMNYDDYGVDKDGNIELIKKTDDKYDVLYAAEYENGKVKRDEDGKMVAKDTDGESGVTEADGVKVKKNHLNNPYMSLHKEQFFEAWGGESSHTEVFDAIWMKGDEQATKLAEFLYDNTDVEWSQIQAGSGSGENGFNIIYTSHHEWTVANGDLVTNKMVKARMQFKVDNHNHPSGNSNSSGGDWRYAEKVLKHSPKCKFNVYTKQSKKYDPYKPGTR